jgi:hypothetical protein
VSVSGITVAFHHNSQIDITGSARSAGTRSRLIASGQVKASVSRKYSDRTPK